MTFRYVAPVETRATYHDLRCDACDAAVESVFGGALQPSGGLVLRVEGGYGMAVDVDFDGDPKGPQSVLVVCAKCVQATPWLKRRVDEINDAQLAEGQALHDVLTQEEP